MDGASILSTIIIVTIDDGIWRASRNKRGFPTSLPAYFQIAFDSARIRKDEIRIHSGPGSPQEIALLEALLRPEKRREICIWQSDVRSREHVLSRGISRYL